MAAVSRFAAFLSLPCSNPVGPQYIKANSDRFDDSSSNKFDVLVKLPREFAPKWRTLVIFDTPSDAITYEGLAEKYHSSLFVPKFVDYRVGDVSGSRSRRRKREDITAAAHIYDYFPTRFTKWIIENPLRDDLWVWSEEPAGRRIVTVTDSFRRFYKNLSGSIKSLHDDSKSYGCGLDGIYLSDSLDVKLSIFDRISEFHDDCDLKGRITQDLKTLGRVTYEVISRNADHPLPPSVRLYFGQFNFLRGSLSFPQFRLIMQFTYMPPFIYDSRQRAKAVDMAWEYKLGLPRESWEGLFSTIRLPQSNELLFDCNWRQGISVLEDPDERCKVANKMLHVRGQMQKAYEKTYGILIFHRNYYAHHEDVFESSSDVAAAERRLFRIWPDAVPQICYCLLFMSLSVDLSVEIPPAYTNPELLLETMKSISLYFEKTSSQQ